MERLFNKQILKFITLLLTLTMIWFSFVLWQYYIFYYYNLFTLTHVYCIFVIIWYNRFFKTSIGFGFRSKQLIIAISCVIFVDITYGLIKKDSVSYVGNSLPLYNFIQYENADGLGYLLKDGDYSLDMKVFKDDKLLSKYSAEYKIRNNRRIINSNNINACPNVILLGGSHNFGQALADDLTLQAMLEKNNLVVVNFSAPGYGLIHSVLNMKLNLRDLKNCSPDAIIYRFIADHINRDNGKRSIFLPNGSFLTEENDTFSIKRIPQNTYSILKYIFFSYLPTRILQYAASSKSELSFQLIARPLGKLWFYKTVDIRNSLSLLRSVPDIWPRSINKPEMIILIDDDAIHIPKKYINGLQLIPDLTVIDSPDTHDFNVWASMNCRETIYKSKFIAYEWHPTDCLNKYYFEKIKTLKINSNLN